MEVRAQNRHLFPTFVAVLAALLLVFAAGTASAQDAPEGDAPEGDAPAGGEQVDPDAPPPPTPEQAAEATKLFQEGQALAKEKKYGPAVEKLKAAFDVYPDPGLLYLIGEALQLLGNEERNFDYYREAVEYYQKYLKAQPEGQAAPTAQERVTQLEEAIAAEDERVAKEKEEEEKAAREAEERRQAELEAARQKELKKTQMQKAFDAMVVAGADQQKSALGRAMFGGLFAWGGFGVDAHLGLDGFLRVDSEQGISGRSFHLDVGARYGFKHHYIGPFVSGGGSFGLFSGKPRERKLSEDMETCPGYDAQQPGQCAFNIDKNIATRLAFGYGFSASETITVAVRVEGQYWLFSVDGTQESGSPPAALIEKPQDAFAFLIGLEFMRWM